MRFNQRKKGVLPDRPLSLRTPWRGQREKTEVFVLCPSISWYSSLKAMWRLGLRLFRANEPAKRPPTHPNKHGNKPKNNQTSNNTTVQVGWN